MCTSLILSVILFDIKTNREVLFAQVIYLKVKVDKDTRNHLKQFRKEKRYREYTTILTS